MQEDFITGAIERHGDAVFRLAICRLQNKSDAEDVYSEVFLKLFRQKGAQDFSNEHLKAWLLRVAINMCNDIGRKKKREKTIPLDAITELSIEEKHEYSGVWEAVSRLNEKYRMVFHLYYAEGYNSNEIAKILRLPPATVRIRLKRAREILRKELTTYEA